MILGLELFGPVVVIVTLAVGLVAGVIHDLTGPRDREDNA